MGALQVIQRKVKKRGWGLKTLDWIKGALVGAGTAAVTAAQSQLFDGGKISGKSIGFAAIGGLLTYVMKNFFTNEKKAAKKLLEKEGGTVYMPNNFSQ